VEVFSSSFSFSRIFSVFGKSCSRIGHVFGGIGFGVFVMSLLLSAPLKYDDGLSSLFLLIPCFITFRC